MFHEASEFAYESLKDDDLPKFVISNTYQRVKAPTLVEGEIYFFFIFLNNAFYYK